MDFTNASDPAASPSGSPPTSEAAGPAVVDVTAEMFESVMAESMSRLVILDFWAPWCQPCRSLGPILEAVARESDGKVLLGKINTDTEQQLAAAFGVQSLPTVVAVRDGRPEDAFQGAMPEAEVRQWIGRFVPSAIEDLLAEAEQLQHSNRPEAIAKYREAVAEAPAEPRATLGLARLLVEDNQLEEAARVLDEFEEGIGPLGGEGDAIRSALELKQNSESGELAAARAASEAAPEDLAAKLAFAKALAADGKNELAMETALAIVHADEGEHREAAKAFMIGQFERLGPTPLVSESRRKLSTALY